MIIEGEHVFNGPREVAFEMFNDPNVLATAVPGMQKLTKVDDQHYEGTMNIRIGPVSGTFAGVLSVTDEVPPESCTLTVDGRGAAGFGNGVGKVHFTDQGDGTTLLKYSGELNIGGTLASVGQRMIDSVAKSMIKTAFETLDKALEMKMVEKNTGKEAKFEAPTQTEFAKSVSKDWFKGLLQIAEVRMVLYVVPVAIIVALIAMFLKAN
ncbi:MAG: carbon monoxide dehydrogenase subunit G [Leptolinea sp.]